jgi:hypothetical protein
MGMAGFELSTEEALRENRGRQGDNQELNMEDILQWLNNLTPVIATSGDWHLRRLARLIGVS